MIVKPIFFYYYKKQITIFESLSNIILNISGKGYGVIQVGIGNEKKILKHDLG